MIALELYFIYFFGAENCWWLPVLCFTDIRRMLDTMQRIQAGSF